ncbi:MAG: serine/threonine-protein kinase [Acidobacteria bacterium]|nr:serine/threonine-protein kinase [Acidobacteriota bacterium]
MTLALGTRLDRTVAIKVLPAHIAERPDLRQRFEREARAVSSLNHPHICSLFDIGQQEGLDYLVMEYLEGETLAARLAGGPLPPELVLRYAIEIADALGQAHSQGVFHRDLKPGNIMLIKSGTKLLDFGLAKLRGPEKAVAAGSLTVSPVPESTLTGAGTILGTIQYMAPEQLEGKETDGRADIFAFGVVLYEMAAGRKAFEGNSPASLIAAILSKDPPPISTLQPVTGRRYGPAFDRLVKKCLAKNPEDRWQTARDLASELQWIAEAGALPGPERAAAGAEAVQARRRHRERLAWSVATVAVLVALFLAVAYFRRAPLEARPIRFSISPPEKTTLAGSIAVSPDGKQLAFVTTSPDGSTSLWVRPFASLTARALPGTEGAVHPFWSPDNRFLGFFAEGKLQKISVEGGPPQALCEVFDARGGTWSRDGVIVFSPNPGDRLYRIAETGGAPTPVTTLDPSRQESSHQWPHFLPDGRHFLFLVWSAQADARGIYIGSLDSKETKRLLGTDWSVAYARGPGERGYLFFLRGRTLMGQAFDAKAVRITGEPFPVAEQVWYDETIPGLTSFSVSESGVLAYRSGGIRTKQLVWYDRTGKPLGAVGPPGPYRDPWLSPDEKRMALTRVDPQTGTQDIWLFELSRGISSRFTFHPSDDATPLWSPDGSRIIFASNRDGPPNLYQKASSGAGNEEPLLKSDVSKYPTGWSGNGRYIVYANWDPKTKWDLWVLPMFGERKPMPYLQTEFDAFQAQFSPDGRWIAYTSNESNPRYEVYVQPFPMSGGKWQISANGGAQPSWRRDGRELFYLAPDRRLMAAEVKPGSTFEPGVPKALFQTQVTGLVDARNHYVASRDGQRFLVNTIVQEATSSPITVVVNWTAGLKQ